MEGPYTALGYSIAPRMSWVRLFCVFLPGQGLSTRVLWNLSRHADLRRGYGEYTMRVRMHSARLTCQPSGFGGIRWAPCPLDRSAAPPPLVPSAYALAPQQKALLVCLCVTGLLVIVGLGAFAVIWGLKYQQS